MSSVVAHQREVTTIVFERRRLAAGDNNFGQLADFSFTDRNSAVPVSNFVLKLNDESPTELNYLSIPVITSTSAYTIAENVLSVGTITATDEDGDTLTFSITGGADSGKFEIDPNSGALTFYTARLRRASRYKFR